MIVSTKYCRCTQVKKGTHLESFPLQDGLELHQQVECRIRGQVLLKRGIDKLLRHEQRI